MQVTNAREAAEALIAALQIRFGEVVVTVSDSGVKVIRTGVTLKPAELEERLIPA